jgi:isoquinoline 1-oxidoreductase subunit beta
MTTSPVLDAPVSNAPISNVSRRGVLKGILAGGGLVLAARIMPVGRPFAQTATAYGAAAMPHGTVNSPNAFI